MPKSKAQPTEGTLPDATGTEAVPRQTKQQLLIDLLSRSEGATLAEMGEASGWQRHTLHGFISGTLKKRFGLTITSTKLADRERVYHAAPDREAKGTPSASN